MDYEAHIKMLIGSAVWHVLEKHDIDIVRVTDSGPIMDEVVEEVYTQIWEYIKDFD